MNTTHFLMVLDYEVDSPEEQAAEAEQERIVEAQEPLPATRCSSNF